MFKNIFLFELKHWLRSPAFYLYLFAFFFLAFMLQAGSAGFFDSPTEQKATQLLNSPHAISSILHYFNKFFLFLLPAIIGVGLYRDYKSQVINIMYTFPMKKRDYLFGKFLSNFFIVLLICFSVAVGLMIAECLPDLHEGKIGSFSWNGYVQSFCFYIIPNMLVFGAIIFSVVLWTRNIFAGFGSIILLLIVQMIIQNAFGQQYELIALLDPFAQFTFEYETRFWTLAEKNTKLLFLSNTLLFNRLIWLSIAGFIFVYTYRKFDFSIDSMASFLTNKKNEKVVVAKRVQKRSVTLPAVTYDYSFSQQLKNSWTLSNFHLQYIVKNWVFLGIVCLGIMAIIFMLGKVTNTGKMNLMPVTNIVLAIPTFFFTSIILLLTFIYSGMLIHRERIAGMNELVDATPISNSTVMGAKILAIIKMQVILLFLMLVAGVILQSYNGYFNFEIGLYFFHLYVIQFIVLIIWAFAATFAHTIFPNVYLSMFLLVLAWFGFGAIGDLGINTKLLQFNSPEILDYSDLNGYGTSLMGYFLVECYWFIFGVLLLILSFLFWQRGTALSIKDRFSVASLRFTHSIKLVSGLLLLGFVALGFTIFKTENSSPYLSGKAEHTAYKTFEKNFKQYQGMLQPRITKLNANINLYPSKQKVEAKGTYTIVNKSDVAIDTLLVKLGFDEITKFEIDRPSKIIHQDDYVQFYVLELDQSLAPKESLQLSFTIKNKSNTLFERNSNILGNGTFLKDDMFPRLGYFLNEDTRSPKKHSTSCNHYQAIDSDLVDIETTISTSGDQLAIAPGYLEKEWTENGRRFFSYKTDKPIKFRFGFNSGKFKLTKDKWQDIDLEIYAHPSHNYNLETMMNGLKGGLAYNTKYFSPYQHREARIIEFPKTEGTYATTFANSIPTSEIRFIATNNKNKSKADLAFYVPAHEITHQWWANQLIPGDALGAVMLTESITEYITLQVYREHLGEVAAQEFLKLQHKRYFRGRAKESGVEASLYNVKSEQQYISYGKGAVVFNSIKHHIGEANLNAVLKAFLLDHQEKECSYPTTIDLVSRLKSSCPDTLQYVIEDHFESVVVYDNKITDAKARTLSDGRHQVELSCSFNKSIQDEEGKTSELKQLNEYIQIGLYNKNDELISIHKHLVQKTDTMISITVEEQPSKIVLDPNLLILDKNLRDNEIDL